MQYLVKILLPSGRIAEEQQTGKSREAIHARVSAAGATVLSIRPDLAGFLKKRHKARGENQLVFCDQLQTLLSAGISLPESLLALRDSERDQTFRPALAAVLSELETGRSFSDALATQSDFFSGILLSMVRAAEKTGSLADALGRYARFQRQADEFRNALWTAATYPLMLLGAGGTVILFLMLYVVPRFATVYNDIHGTLPWSARLLLTWGEFAEGRGTLILVVFLAFMTLTVGLAFRRETRQRLFEWLLKLPHVGIFLKEIQLAHYFHSLGLLLTAGIPLIQALDLSRGLLAESLRSAADGVHKMVREGGRLSAGLDMHQLTSPVALRLIQAGERSGQLGAMLKQAAEFHDQRIVRTTGLIARLIGPALMLLMGLVIGGIVVLLYMPIFQLAEGLG